MYTIVYFSPTGNVLHLANKLAIFLEREKVNILPLEFINHEKLTKDKHLILIYPVHGFNAPRTVRRFIKNLPSKLFDVVNLLAVGCSDNWMNGAVSSDLRKQLKQKGYLVAVDEVMAMPLTFIMNFPQELNLKLIADSEKKVVDICQSIIDKKVSVKKVEIKSKILNFVGKGESPAARLFGLELYANNNCDYCGTCWNNCPEKNIKPNSKGKPKFKFNCLMCMRCIYNCPQKAINPRFSKFIPIKQGYSLSKILNN